ncbi:hypothetical protein D6D21_06710 [Aureobasidium pullulans]|uniref:C3H1-type domain-containing protein n=1 Tax=Aureobasidium pullulans TaxID=5580 RepID=A0AB74ITB1_AURPU|nr:hypothetical protein D6D21_06710 [Aureobasidium pullulans]
MLAETELNKLEGQLANFNISTKARQDALEELTLSYGQLLEDYRTLRSDYEEEKESREKYKKLARGQERNPFVLVLVDADGYVFEDSLIKGGAEGGVRAANLLHDTIRDRLSRYGREYENCKVMVRAYTNLAGLSKTLARAGLAGNEARSLSPFCSNFTRAHDLFDFVDAGDKKENADNKIREMFRLFIENNQCKHIFFAGCHDTGYLNLLTPYIGKNDKITLVHGSSFSPEFNRLGLNIDSLNGLFHNNPLDGLDARRPNKPPPASSQSMAMSNGHSGSAPPSTPICTHYLRGTCKFGNGCKKSHSTGGDSWRPNEHTSGREFAHRNSIQSSFFPPPASYNTPVPSSTGVDSPLSGMPLTSPGYGSSAFPPASPSMSHVQPSVALPRQSPENANLVPVNKDGHRLDFYLQTPTSEDWKAYNARVTQQKLCNEHQLKGYCKKGQESCGFDHSPISDGIKLVLKHMVHDYPCGRKGDCRFKNCNMGHICFREKCGGSSGKGACRLNRFMHGIDPVVAQWVPAVQDMEVYNPDSFGITSGENNVGEENDITSHATSDPPQSENGVNLPFDPEPHSSDLD